MDHSRLSGLLTTVLSDQGLELDDLEVTAAGRRQLVRVTVDGDGPAGRGPDLDQIAVATRQISALLDESDLVGDKPYTLEVSSRGIARPLARPAHYRRNIGRLLTLTLASGEQVDGRLTAADEQSLTLDVAGQPVGYQLAEVTKAVVQVEFNRRPEGAADDEMEN